MGRWVFIMCMGLLVGWLATASAVDIQYNLATTWVSAVSDVPLDSVSGYGLVTLTGHTASEIIWPLPSGCPAGTGTWPWSLITNPATVAVDGTGLALRPGLIFFHSTSSLTPGCYPVGSKKQLRALVDQLIVAGVIAQDQNHAVVDALNWHWGWYYARCGDAPTNQNCVDWKTQLNIMLTRYPGRSQGITAATAGAILTTDEVSFLNAQCTANPGGPFC